MQPFVTIVVPTFDRAPVVARAIDSVLAQTFGDLELVVVDDGSSDATADVVRRYRDPRLLYLAQPHRGVSAARNHGAARARGEVLTFLDSDDEALPEWIEKLTRPFADPAVGLVSCGSSSRILREHRLVSERIELPRPSGPLHQGWPLRYAAGNLAMRSALFRAAGGYDEELGYAENSELALRLTDACHAAGLILVAVPEALVIHNRQEGAWSRDPERFRLIRHATERILERHGARMKRANPRGYASYRGVAAVNAARGGELAAARRHLRQALQVRAGRRKNLLRLALTYLPLLGRRFWLRHDGRSA